MLSSLFTVLVAFLLGFGHGLPVGPDHVLELSATTPPPSSTPQGFTWSSLPEVSALPVKPSTTRFHSSLPTHHPELTANLTAPYSPTTSTTGSGVIPTLTSSHITLTTDGGVIPVTAIIGAPTPAITWITWPEKAHTPVISNFLEGPGKASRHPEIPIDRPTEILDITTDMLNLPPRIPLPTAYMTGSAASTLSRIGFSGAFMEG